MYIEHVVNIWQTQEESMEIKGITYVLVQHCTNIGHGRTPVTHQMWYWGVFIWCVASGATGKSLYHWYLVSQPDLWWRHIHTSISSISTRLKWNLHQLEYLMYFTQSGDEAIPLQRYSNMGYHEHLTMLREIINYRPKFLLTGCRWSQSAQHLGRQPKWPTNLRHWMELLLVVFQGVNFKHFIKCIVFLYQLPETWLTHSATLCLSSRHRVLSFEQGAGVYELTNHRKSWLPVPV